MKRIKELEKLIKLNKDLYYNGTPEISDKDFDDLEDELRSLDPDNKVLQLVGSPIKNKKVKLPFILGSLNKIKAEDIEEDSKLFDRTFDKFGDTVVSIKLDGVSCLTEYKDGKVSKAYTRGDSEYGFDITEKVKKFAPDQKIPIDGFFRAEIMMIGEKHLELGYSVRRSTASGIINRDGFRHVEHLSIVFYEVVEVENMPSQEVQRFELLQKTFGNECVANHMYKTEALTPEFLDGIYHKAQETCNAIGLDIDGLVICRNKSSRSNSYYPKWKIAYKKNKQGIPTEVLDIEWVTSRNGRCMPVVLINPTDIDGVTISRVTGHNYKNIFDKKINKGAIIEIVRGGDVIPYINSVLKESEDTDFIKNCPSCNQTLKNIGVDLVCENSLCDSKIIKRASHFFKTLGVKGVSEKSFEKVIHAFLVRDIISLFDLSVEDIKSIEGFQQKSATTFVTEIMKSIKDVEDYKFLSSLGISGLGKTMSKSLLTRYEIEEVFSDDLNMKIDPLCEIEGVAEKTASNIIDGINSYKDLYKNLISRGMTFKEEEVISSNELSGKTICITGKLSSRRSDIEDRIESKGGKVTKSVSKKTDYLVCNEVSESGKYKKAMTLDVKIITEKQLFDM